MGSCPEALQILRGFRQIDLLFSDIVMPGKLNGIQLAAHRCEQLAANPSTNHRCESSGEAAVLGRAIKMEGE